MLLWLEEAGIEMAMILAVAVGSFMLIGAVWTLVRDWLRTRAERHDGRLVASADEGRPGSPSRPTGHSV